MCSVCPPWPQLKQALADPRTGLRHRAQWSSGFRQSRHNGACVTLAHITHSVTNSTPRLTSALTDRNLRTLARGTSKPHRYRISAYERLKLSYRWRCESPSIVLHVKKYIHLYLKQLCFDIMHISNNNLYILI